MLVIFEKVECLCHLPIPRPANVCLNPHLPPPRPRKWPRGLCDLLWPSPFDTNTQGDSEHHLKKKLAQVCSPPSLVVVVATGAVWLNLAHGQKKRWGRWEKITTLLNLCAMFLCSNFWERIGQIKLTDCCPAFKLSMAPIEGGHCMLSAQVWSCLCATSTSVGALLFASSWFTRFFGGSKSAREIGSEPTEETPLGRGRLNPRKGGAAPRHPGWGPHKKKRESKQ